MLQFRDVCKGFSGHPVIAGLTLGFREGSTSAIIGSSGCGKSTLLRLALGLVTPDSGEVHYRGRCLREVPELSFRQSVGYVIQNGGLFPHLTSAENVSLLATHLKWSPERIGSRIETLLALVHLPPDVLDRYPAQLSGGQRQRVALMRALMLDPELLLLDEPLSALDPIVRHDLQNDLKAIFASLEKTVIVVTHDLSEAAWLADRIHLLDGGSVVQSGAYEELLDTPATPFVTRFVDAQRRRGPTNRPAGTDASL